MCIKDIRLLDERFGGWWCGVKFSKAPARRNRRAVRPMRFCEAIDRSRKGPISLTPEVLDCPGGSRCLGWNADDEKIAPMIAQKAGIRPQVVREILRNTPRLEDDVGEVIVGTYNRPDVVVSYSQPETAMKLLRQWQRSHGHLLALETSGYMSVCGAVAVKVYLTGKICISFGCPDAREHGNIGRDRLVIGLPIQQVHNLVKCLD